jgi:hypothetical protein
METYFKVKTPLNVQVRTTKDYWEYLVTKKHKVLHNKEDVVMETLRNPDEIRKSSIDHNVFLYYRKYDRLYCVVARHIESDGFLITAYPTDKVKEGGTIWTK